MKLSNLSLLDQDMLAFSAGADGPVEVRDVEASGGLLDMFEARAALMGDGLACADEGVGLSYRELDERSNQVARYLVASGLEAGARVGLWFRRSPDYLVGLLGTLKAGGCYVPLDTAYPAAYVASILEDARPWMVLLDPGLEPPAWAADGDSDSGGGARMVRLDAPAVTGCAREAVRCPRGGADDLAYVMYTSGSTGRPKGVMVTHRQILNWLHALWARAPFGEHEVVAQKTSIGFAISAKELLAGLLAGTPQVFIGEDTVRDAPALARALERWGVTRLYTFPSQLSALLDEEARAPGRLSRLSHLFVSIEPCPVALLERLEASLPGARAWYIYGCTEINDITYCDPGEARGGSGFVPVGRAIANTRVLVLDERLRRVPVGIMGEVYVESVGAARGYWDRPGLTAQRFVANPYGTGGGRLYRTGDMARQLEGGALELLGRRDHEVKVRGYRVDVRQVEKVLLEHPAVAEAAVTGWSREGSGTELVAYVAVRRGELDAEALRRDLLEKLPTYMAPTRFEALAALPRLPNGKLDVQALPEPSAPRTSRYAAPEGEVQVAVAEIWSALLSPREGPALRVGLGDNFFNLGGHSLLATQLFSRLRQRFQVEVAVNALFEAPVLESFSRIVQQAVQARTANTTTPTSPIMPLAQRNGPGLYCIHPIGGQVGAYMDVARQLTGVAVHGLQGEGDVPFEDLAELAGRYCDAIVRHAGDQEPFRLLGWSSGGLIALAMARELEARGRRVDYLGLIDSDFIPQEAGHPRQLTFAAAVNALVSLRGRPLTQREAIDVRALLFSDDDDEAVFDYPRRPRILDELQAYLGVSLDADMWGALAVQLRVIRRHLAALVGFRPTPPGDRTFYYRAAEQTRVSYADMSLPLAGDLPETLSDLPSLLDPNRIAVVPGHHYSMLKGEAASVLSQVILRDLGLSPRAGS